MAKPKLPTFQDEERYQVTFGASAQFGDARFKPGNLYKLKGKVAKVVKEAIVEAELISEAEPI